MSGTDDIAIASVAASLKDDEAPGADGELGGRDSGNLVERFETIHQRVANASSNIAADHKRGGAASARPPWLAPVLWGGAAATIVVGLGVQFRPAIMMREPEESEDEEADPKAPRKFALLRVAAGAAAVFAVVALTALAQQKFGGRAKL